VVSEAFGFEFFWHRSNTGFDALAIGLLMYDLIWRNLRRRIAWRIG
jgi:hypothetical protein